MADVKEPLVLFLIGMRINTLWRVWEWFPSPKPATGLLFLAHDQNEGVEAL